MKEIKDIFDPQHILNPGVILNSDPEAHLRHLKPLPPSSEIVDKCIECGFCEVQCPSRDLTLTPRQRIVVWREIMRLERTGESPSRLRSLRKEFRYYGDETCATDGLCALACPVAINTGELVKELRNQNIGKLRSAFAWFLANNMKPVTSAARLLLNVLDLLHSLFGSAVLTALSKGLRLLSRGGIRLWNAQMPKGADRIPAPRPSGSPRDAIVYFPTCINRTFGVSQQAGDNRSLVTVALQLLEKSGFDVRIPDNVDALCCGMAFTSKGYFSQGNAKSEELERALVDTSENGRLPILVDMTPCLQRMKDSFKRPLPLYDQSQFSAQILSTRLVFTKRPEPVMLHPTCSSTKMGITGDLQTAASLCSDSVVVPDGIGCCGWAGDRGFTFPELNASALLPLKKAIPDDCCEGYSNSRTCELGLSLHGGIPYRSILYLIDRCSAPRSAGHSPKTVS